MSKKTTTRQFVSVDREHIMEFAISYSSWNKALHMEREVDRDGALIVWGELLLKDAEKLGQHFLDEINHKNIRRCIEHARQRHHQAA